MIKKNEYLYCEYNHNQIIRMRITPWEQYTSTASRRFVSICVKRINEHLVSHYLVWDFSKPWDCTFSISLCLWPHIYIYICIYSIGHDKTHMESFYLTHWDRDKANSISQTTFFKCIFGRKLFYFRWKVYEICIQGPNEQYASNESGNASWGLAIIWTKDDLIPPCM